MLRISDALDSGAADLVQIKATYLAGHANRDPQIGIGQNVGKGGREEGGLLHGPVIIVHKIHCIRVNVCKKLIADAFQLDLCIAGCGACHVPGKHLSEVALAVHKGGQQSTVAAAHTDHRIIDGALAVGIQLHGLTHHIGRFGAAAGEQIHLVHGIQQLAVRWLKAVDLRQSAGYDDAHGIGHEVFREGLCNAFFRKVHIVPPFNSNQPVPDIARRCWRCNPCGPGDCRPAADQRPERSAGHPPA